MAIIDGLLALGVLLLVYLLPAVVGFCRDHHNQLAIFVLNLFLGWTLLGWVLALVWACTVPRAGRS
jgi:hypothetical protein